MFADKIPGVGGFKKAPPHKDRDGAFMLRGTTRIPARARALLGRSVTGPARRALLKISRAELRGEVPAVSVMRPSQPWGALCDNAVDGGCPHLCFLFMCVFYHAQGIKSRSREKLSAENGHQPFDETMTVVTDSAGTTTGVSAPLYSARYVSRSPYDLLVTTVEILL